MFCSYVWTYMYVQKKDFSSPYYHMHTADVTEITHFVKEYFSRAHNKRWKMIKIPFNVAKVSPVVGEYKAFALKPS